MRNHPWVGAQHEQTQILEDVGLGGERLPGEGLPEPTSALLTAGPEAVSSGL